MRALILCSLALVTVGSPALADYDFQRDWYETGVVGDGWGDAATTVGDINGDGYSDILIGSPQYDFFSNLSAGLVSLYRGSSTGPSSTPDWVFTAGVSFGQFGYTIAAAGDMNADGFDDFVVAAPSHPMATLRRAGSTSSSATHPACPWRPGGRRSTKRMLGWASMSRMRVT